MLYKTAFCGTGVSSEVETQGLAAHYAGLVSAALGNAGAQAPILDLLSQELCCDR